MNLTIGLLQHDAGWEQLLMQIGAAWKVYDASQTMSADSFAVMIVNAEPTTMQRSDLIDYLNAGGMVLADDGRVRFFLDCKIFSKQYSSLSPQDCAPFSPASILDVYTRGRYVTHCEYHSITDTAAAQIITGSAGTVVSLPFPVGDLMVAGGSRRKNFYAAPERLPSEGVSSISRGSLRQLVTKVLEFLHHARSFPFVHTWYYPNGHASVFTFRVDTDMGSQTQLGELYDVCVRHKIRGTWFIDVKSHEDWLEYFTTFRHQEIGLHCYEHKTADEKNLVLDNFGKGQRLLTAAGLNIRGASAPCGTWNAAVDAVYRDLHMDYSSEFSLDYDDLPFFPLVDGSLSPVLQLPIHPICVGSMKRSRYTAAQMKTYYRAWIRSCMAAHEPICLYHHPTHYHWDVFEDIFGVINELHIPSLSYSEYAEWWRKRIAVIPQLQFENGTITVINDSDMNCEFYYRISLAGDQEIITKIDGTCTLADAPGQQHADAPVPDDIMRARKFDVRHPLINFLDYWYKTTQ